MISTFIQLFIILLTLYRIQGKGGGGGGGPTGGGGGCRKSASPISFSSVTSTNAEISPKNFLNFSFNPFATLV